MISDYPSLPGIPALPANFGLTPTPKPTTPNMSVVPNMSVIPPKAPTNQTSTTSSPATPTAVVTTDSAVKDLSHISDHTNQADQAIKDQQAAKAASDAAAAAKADSDAAAAKTAAATKPTLTPEQHVLNQPDPGNMFVYDKATGERSQVPVGSAIPSDLTMTDVKNAGAVNTVTVGNTEYRDFGTGTYGMFDTSTGKYLGAASAQNFSDAKGVQQGTKDFESIKNGTYPLTTGQQAQLDEMKDYYQELIDAQKVMNDNITGNTTGLQNLFGVGGTPVGISAINQSIQEGQQRIAKINDEMVTKVAALKSAIQQDQVNLVRDLYTQYQGHVDDKQKAIDAMHADLQKTADRLQAANISTNENFAKKFTDVDQTKYPGGITPDMTAEQRNAALATSPTYKQTIAMSAAMHNVLTPEENDWYGEFEGSGASKYLNLPGGRSAAGIQMNIPIIQSIIKKAQSAGVSGAQFGEALSDKTTAAHVLTQISAQGEFLRTQEKKTVDDILGTPENGKKDGLEYLASRVNEKEYQSNVPLLQRYLQGVDVQVNGSPEFVKYAGLLKTTLTQYARVVNSQTGSAGTSVNINDEIQKILPPGASPKLAVDYLKNVAIPEMKHTTDAYQGTEKDLSDTIGRAIGDQTHGTTTVTPVAGGSAGSTPSKVETNSDGTIKAVSF